MNNNNQPQSQKLGGFLQPLFVCLFVAFCKFFSSNVSVSNYCLSNPVEQLRTWTIYLSFFLSSPLPPSLHEPIRSTVPSSFSTTDKTTKPTNSNPKKQTWPEWVVNSDRSHSAKENLYKTSCLIVAQREPQREREREGLIWGHLFYLKIISQQPAGLASEV
jgi:hypothetical protein